MADAAPQLDDDEEQRSHLRGLEGGAEGGGPASSRGNIQAAPDPTYDTKGNAPSEAPGGHLRAVPDEQDLKQREENATGAPPAGGIGTGQHENAFERGYTGKGASAAIGRFSLRGRLSRRRAAVGGGAIGALLVTGAILFTSVSGPLELVHFAQILTRFHFTNQSDAQDGRFLKEVRFYKYAKDGHLEKTRLSRFANAWASKYEERLSGSGLASAYSPVFQNFDGYKIDKSKFKNADGTQMNDEDIKTAIKDKYGVEVIDGNTLKHNPGLKGELVVSSRDLSPLENVKLTYNLLRSEGLNKLSAANGARLLIVRDGVTYHPIKNLKTKGETQLELKKAVNQTEQQAIDQGSTTEITANDTTLADENAPPDKKASAASGTSSADQTIQEGKNLDKALTSGEGDAAVAKSALSLKSGLVNGALIYGTACILNSFNEKAPELKQEQVIKPLIRLAAWTIAAGEEVRSGQPPGDIQTLGVLSQQLDGVDSSGKKTSWVDGASIQSNLGNPGKGVQPDSTLKSIGTNQVPFPFLQPYQGAIHVACSPVFSGAALAISFFGGEILAPLTEAFKGAVQTIVLDKAIALWVGGHAINPSPVGADRGLAADFGSALAANEQAVASGGTVLNTSQQSALLEQTNEESQAEFNSHSIAYRLFNTQDQRTAISKLIDNSSPSVSENIAKVGSAFLNIGHLFGSLGSLFSTKAQAASQPYNYGFPIYGFSSSELNDAKFENPYQNACYVVGGCTDPDTGQATTGFLGIDPATNAASADGQNYISKAKDCFGVDIGPDANGDWGVTSSANSAPELYNNDASSKHSYPGDCSAPSGLDATNWQRLRFFILDTESAESMSCYQGDSEACTNIGYNSSSSGSSSASSTSTTTAAGTCSVTKPVYGSVNGVGSEYSQDQLAAIFGDPGSASSHPAMDANLVNISFLGHSVQVNKAVAPCLSAVAQEIQTSGSNYAINDIGCYRFDSDNGKSNIGLRSYHTYGAACDINTSTNPFVENGADTAHDMPDAYVKAFSDHGFTWGGNWHQPKDYMHFEFNGITP